MIIKLNMTSEIPIYVQLRNEIVLGIGRGELKAGEQLPTVRQMAADIGVNTMTVNKSYQILKAEGFILGKIFGEHPQGAGAERLSGGSARQGRRLPPDPQPRPVHRGGDPHAHRGQPGPRHLPDAGCIPLRPPGQLPHL